MSLVTSSTNALSGVIPGNVAVTVPVGGTPAPTPPPSPSPSPVPAPSDQVNISEKGVLTAKYVAEVRAVAPLDTQTIKQLKADIARGVYPPPTLIEGLLNLVGTTIPGADASADPTAASS